MFTLYLIKFRSYLYTGQTANLKQRLEEHGPDAQLLYTEEYPSRSAAVKREGQIKGWSRAKKQALVAGDEKALKGMAKRGVKAPLSYKHWTEEKAI